MMTIKTLMQATIKKLFEQTAPDLMTAVTYTHLLAEPVYNAATGVMTASELKVQLRVLFTAFKAKDVDGTNIKPFDKNVIFERQKISFRPKLTDYMEDPEGKWQIVQVKDEATESVYILHVRRA